MIGTEIVVLLAFISRFSLDRKLTDLKEEISEKQDIITANASFEQDVRTLQNKLATAKTLMNPLVNPFDILTLFERITPQGVYMQSLEVTASTLSVQAVAGSTNAFSQFLTNLESSKQLSEIDIGNINRDPLIGIQFTFTARIGGGKKK